MVSEFSTFGSCSSRNIFASSSNENYKNFFNINFSLEAITLISLMSKPLKFDSNLLNSTVNYDNFCVYHDLKKHEYLDFIKENKLDYLLFDTYFDVMYDIIIINEDTCISCTERLMNTDLGELYKNYERINIQNDFNRFMNLWIAAFDSFFNFIEKNSNCKIILNCSRPVYRYFSSFYKGPIEDSKLKSTVPIYHEKFRNILDTFILKNYDVEALPFDNTTLANPNHIFGLHPTHYEPRYYKEKTNQINNIIKFNELHGYSDKFNLERRGKIRKKIIRTFEENKITNFKYKKNMGIFESLPKYLTARIDVKNEGNESNSIELLEISDENASIMHPQWFCDMKGEGIQIHSRKGNITLKMKCNNEGNLLIRLMGMDMRDNFGNRIPIYIKFTEFTINGEKMLKDNIIVHHDNSKEFRKMVKDLEEVTITASWSMF